MKYSNLYSCKVPFIKLAFLAFIVTFASCEDVIRVNLNNASPRIVIDGFITNINDTCKVVLSRTTDYFNPGSISGVSGALVSIRNNAGDSLFLTESTKGVYYTTKMKGIPGNTYTLSVKADGTEYVATSKMPDLVRIDSLAILSHTDRPDENAIQCYIKDPAGIPDYYQIRVIRNDTMLSTNNRFLIYSDKYFDGRTTTITLDSRRFSGVTKFRFGDTLKVQLLNIDYITYQYYITLRSITNSGSILSASTPANPVNNISNGGLGHFSAESIHEKTIVVE